MEVYIRDIVSSPDALQKDCLVIFFSGCDFNCGFCNTTDLIKKFNPEHRKDIREIKKVFDQHKAVTDSILFAGGEPCLQKAALVELTLHAKHLGYTIRIETNGSKPAVLQTLLQQKLLDNVFLDIKSPFTEQYDKVIKASNFFIPIKTIVDDIRYSLELLRKSAQSSTIVLTIRTTIVPGLLYKKEDLLTIAAAIKEINCTWMLQRFHNDKKVIDKRYQEILPPSTQFMYELRDAVLKAYPQMRIEVND